MILEKGSIDNFKKEQKVLKKKQKVSKNIKLKYKGTIVIFGFIL